MWKIVCREEQATDGNLARAHCWILKPTNTHTGYLKLNAFPL